MTLAVIIAEKPSQARNFAAALGGMSGTYQGQSYEIANVRGHVYEFVGPHEMVAPDLAAKYQKWDITGLPWNPQGMDWRRRPAKDVGAVIRALKDALARADEIVIATDLDSTGEGDLLAWEAIDELGFNARGNTFSRMEFTDEAVASVQKSFVSRRKVISMQDEGAYRKAVYRSKFDYLSMQWSRVASILVSRPGATVVLRQGRLKSAMVKLVGDQYKLWGDYVRKPFFAPRFTDENGVIYTDPDEQRHDHKSDVDLGVFTTSPVVCDSRTDKQTAPPKLLDLAALSTILAKSGMKPAAVLKTYQAGYEKQYFSYPRTEDKTITPEQFTELAPLVDRIAQVVGVDPGLLTHRGARPTHVKAAGAHGANRPGPKVPTSLAALGAELGTGAGLIYETLAKNYLAMLAPDYLYEQQKGHVEKYPSFVGVANVARSLGWKAVFDPTADLGDDSDAETSAGLGQQAEPFVFEGANKRPEHPSMRWLMKQLEKRDVGTGATRTSTYAEVTNSRAKHPLLVDSRGKLTLAESGEMSWKLLPGTHIGDLGLTEKVYADMAAIAAGTADPDQCLSVVADWVRADIATMTANAATLGLKPPAARAEGVWQTAPGGPKQVVFKRSWSGHEFSDDEITQLLRGEEIEFEAVSARTGKPFTATGGLRIGEYQGRKFVGFQLQRPDRPTAWSGHTFTSDEVAALMSGKQIEVTDFVSAKTGNTFSCKVRWDLDTHRIVADFGSDDEPPMSWSGRTFTDAERQELAQGASLALDGFVSRKSGKTYRATISWKTEGGRRKIVPDFARSKK